MSTPGDTGGDLGETTAARIDPRFRCALGDGTQSLSVSPADA
jgi:hypothetical protein